MARLPYLDCADLAPEHQDPLARSINLNRMLVHSPNAARAFGGLGHFIRQQSRLDPRLRELAILQVGYLALANISTSFRCRPTKTRINRSSASELH